MKKVATKVISFFLAMLLLTGVMPIEALALELSLAGEDMSQSIEMKEESESENEDSKQEELEEDSSDSEQSKDKEDHDSDESETDMEKEKEGAPDSSVSEPEINQKKSKEKTNLINPEENESDVVIQGLSDIIEGDELIIDDETWRYFIDDPDIDILSFAPYSYEISFTDGEPVDTDYNIEEIQTLETRKLLSANLSKQSFNSIQLLASSGQNVTGIALGEWNKAISLKNTVDGTTHQWLKGSRVTRIRISGEDAYCLQPGAPLKSASMTLGAMSGQSYWNKAGKTKQQMIGLILYFGSDDDDDGSYLAKQIMIWEVILGYRNAITGKVTNTILEKSLTGPNASSFNSAYKKINAELLRYLTAPTFSSVISTIAPTTQVTKDATTGEWYGEMIDTTGVWNAMDIAKLNDSSEANQAGATFSHMDSGGKKGIRVTFGTTEPDEAKLNSLIFPIENATNSDIAANGETTSTVYADLNKKDNQILLGKAKADPIKLYFKLSKVAVPDVPPPEEEEEEPVKTVITGQKYGEYEDEGGLGGATFVVYQTRRAETYKKDGTVKEEEKEFDPPKKLTTIKSADDGSFTFSVKGDGDYYIEEKEGTYATKGGYILNGKRISNYLTPETTGEEPIEFSVSDGEVDTDYFEFYNYQQKGRITVEKRDVSTGKTPQGDGKLSGAKFKIFAVEGHDDDGRPYGSTVETLTTGSNGRATSGELQEGIHYAIEETNAPVGYLLYTNGSKPWYQEFVIEFDGDHENEVTDTYTLVTGMNGEKLVLGGKSSLPFICTNKVKQGYIKINKFLQKDIDGNPYEDDNQPKMPVPGVIFDVYLASATPKKAGETDIEKMYIFRKSKIDGHTMTDSEMLLNANNALGHVATVKTGIDGTAVTPVLPYGKYVIVERTPLTGYDRPMPVEQWVDTKVTWYKPTKEFVPVIGGDGRGNDNNLGLEHNPPSADDAPISIDDVKQMQALADVQARNDYDPDYYDGYMTENEYQTLLDYYYEYLDGEHYVDRYGNEQDENGNPYDDEILSQGGRLLTSAEVKQFAENRARSLIINYFALNGDGDEIGDYENVYSAHLQEYIDAHGKAPDTVDMLTVTLNIENQTTKRYVRILKQDSVSGKLIPLNNFYFKVWDCTRKRWVEDNRNNASLGNINVWQTNAYGEVVSKPNPDGSTTDLQGTASLVDFLEYGEDGYDIYEIHSHSGYYLTDKPVHFVFDGESNPKGEPIIVYFQDDPVLGNATLHKTGEGLISITKNPQTGVSTPGYEVVNIPGAIYGVYAAEDIKALDIDATIRENRNSVLNASYTVDERFSHTISFTFDTLLKKDALVETIQTDANGLATTSNLYCGKYYLKELYAPVGYTLSTEKILFEIKDTHNIPFDFSDPFLNPQKPTAENPNNTITKTNIDYSKEAIRLGKVEPNQAPTLSPLEMVFVKAKNKRQHVKASFIKHLVQPVNTKTLDWSGSKVKIYAKEDTAATTPIATLAATTPAEALLKTKLKPGDYFAIMVIAPKEVECKTERFNFTLTKPEEKPGEDGTTGTDPIPTPPAPEPTPTDDAVEYTLDLTQSFQYSYTKEEEMKHLVPTPSELYQKITFGLYAATDLLSAKDGTVVILKDTLLQVVSVTNNGQGVSIVDLPIGDYYLKELTAADGYIKDDSINQFAFYPDTDKTNLTIQVTSGSFVNRTEVTTNEPPKPEVPNKPHKPGKPPRPVVPPVGPPTPATPENGILEIVKSSSFDGKLLPFAVYGIYSAGTLVDTLTTDSQGWAKSKPLTSGTYTLKEISAPAHYKLDLKAYQFTIQSEKTIRMSVKDEPIFGSINPSWVDPDIQDSISGKGDEQPTTILGEIRIPKTGDDPMKILIAAAVMLLSGFSLLLLTVKNNRKKKKRIISFLICLVLPSTFLTPLPGAISVSNIHPSDQVNVEQGSAIRAELKENNIEEIQIYTAQDPEVKKAFPDTKEDNGQKYELQNVIYNIVTEKDILLDTVVKRSVTYDNLYKKDVEAPDILNLKENNINLDLKLSGIDYQNIMITGRKYNLTASTDYGYRSDIPKAIQQKNVEYQDSVTGQVVKATLSLVSVKATDDWTWKDDLTIPLVFSIYDAEYYKIGDKVVPYSAKAPALEGCETELLNVLKLSPQDYKISKFEWDGDPYDVDGVMHRKAKATGSRHVARYVASYSGTIPLPDAPGYNAIANYEGTVKLPDTSGAKEYTIEAIATYTQVTGFDFKKAVVPIMIGLILLILLVVAILYISSQKKRKKAQEIEINDELEMPL
ncbi:prealbumin-like fold domain-containing protein [Clostridium minihomine]|uniref:prealbumin-like fold domain-containing protein n=1 Tax=Clostridium minihomine TaxID=2045012 RepID=UPI000C78F94B|nr:prealbumin-like fold domain-containing protein [Clostridium minihomine]